MYSILHFLYDPMMRAIREDEVLLYTGPLKTDEVDALECIAKTFKIEYVRQDLTQQVICKSSHESCLQGISAFCLYCVDHTKS
jgi:hypothetical protein